MTADATEQHTYWLVINRTVTKTHMTKQNKQTLVPL